MAEHDTLIMHDLQIIKKEVDRSGHEASHALLHTSISATSLGLVEFQECGEEQDFPEFNQIVTAGS